MGWTMKDWALETPSKLVGRAKLDQRHAILDPASPWKASQRSNPRHHGKEGKDRHTKCKGWILCHIVTMGQKLRKEQDTFCFNDFLEP
jgi:hypothetical protein